ncbi:MAG: chromosome segregation protein SMC [Clostridia bacterium]
MNFKRIEVYGFKSFADKLTVDFENGITAIVGPNGCGKSNVADAIRWVLGEQNARVLRGKNMQDVIFNGTTLRKQMSYCEVSLVFDNSQHIFPVDFDELVISRKLYRDGESRYCINRTDCKLKDVVDILRDTGIGRDGYSIIAQGKINEIMNSRAEERRNIFEEAAGIAKFKSRKKEAERKLERTHENIERYEDIIAELDKQLGPLKRQSEEATKFLEYKEQLTTMEANAYIYQFENNANFKLNIKNKIEAIEQEILFKESQIKQAENDYTKKNIEINNADVYINNLKEEKTALMVANEKISGETKLLTEQVKNFNAELERICYNTDSYQTKFDDKSSQLDVLKAEKETKTAELNSKKIEFDKVDSEYIALVEDIIQGENKVEDSNKAMFDALDKLADVKADISAMRAESEGLSQKKTESKLMLEKNQQNLDNEDAIKNSIERNLRMMQTSKEEAQRRKAELEDLQIKYDEGISSLTEDIRTITSKISSLETRKKILADFKNEYGGFQGGVKNLMQASKDYPLLQGKIKGLIAEIIKVPAEYEVAIEMALGAALQNIVVENEDDSKFIINYLKEKCLGRVTLLPLSAVKPRTLEREYYPVLREAGCCGVADQLIEFDEKYYNVISYLLGKTLICEDIDSAIRISKRYSYAFKIVTLQGEVFNAGGSITGGSKKSDNTNLLSTEREIEKTQELFEKAQQIYDDKVEKLKKCRNITQENNYTLKEVEEELKQREISFATEQEKQEKCQEKIEVALQNINQYQAIIDTAEARLKEINQQISLVSKISGDMQGKRNLSDNMLDEFKTAFTAKKLRKDELNGAITKMRVGISTLENDCENINLSVERITSELEELSGLIALNKKEFEQTQAKLDEAEKALNHTNISSEDKKKIDQLDARVAEVEQLKRDAQEQIMQINADKEKYLNELYSAREKKLKEENQIEKVDGAMFALSERLSSEYNLTHEKAMSLKVEDFDYRTAVTEINRVKKLKNALGNVNIEAIEQYKEVGARFEEMSGQRDDLNKAEGDLNKIITDLSAEMLERFNTEFNKINENFKVIFKELFNGGKAELVIDTECEDPLEAGIEIMAEPPGKKLRQISLLSGGEMALTAIAILFAIIKLKPMPFCVLDEIEAALDDSNVGLFAQYLKRFSEETQFIVITHRKPTMELADRLYGVTMQEKGVSKIVSVALADAIKVSAEGE